MGRTKTYNPEEIARKAMELFWEYGFHGTSTQELVEHMNVNRYSLYAEFGSKQGLYEAALSLYERDVVTSHFGALQQPGAGLAEIDHVLAFFGASARRPGAQRGCFLCNTATERAPHDPSSQSFVSTYIDTISSAFTSALDNAKRAGELRTDVKTKDEGRFLAATMLGFFVLMRARVEPKVMHGAARSARSHVRALSA